MYPLDKVIRSLNNWGQVYKWLPATYCWGNPTIVYHSIHGIVAILLVT